MAVFMTKPCVVCGQPSFIPKLNEKRIRAWQDGMLIQDAFPEMDTDTRELMISGTHPACWERMWREEVG